MAEQSGKEAERRRLVVTVVVSCVFLMQGIDGTLLTTAIPTISADLGVPPVTLHFTITAYILALAIFMPVSGWFADRFGARRVFCWSTALFSTFAVSCMFVADNLMLLIACRFLQGCCGAVMTPMGRLISLRAYGAKRVLESINSLAVVTLVGPLFGPLVAGLMVNYLPWRFVFTATAPLCVIAVTGALLFIEPDGELKRPRFDLRGFLLIGSVLGLFQVAVENLSHPFVPAAVGIGLFALCGFLGVAYWRYARRTDDPALDVSLFGVTEFRIAVIAGGIGRTGLNAIQFLLPLLMQIAFAFSPLVSGVVTFCAGIGAVTGRTFLSRAIERFGYRAILLTLTLLGGALVAGLALFQGALVMPVFLLYVIVLGMARSSHFNTINALTFVAIPRGKLSRSVASSGVFQQIAMALSTSLSAAVLGLSAGYDQTPALGDFVVAFVAMGAVPLLSVPFILGLHADAGRRLAEKGGRAI